MNTAPDRFTVKVESWGSRCGTYWATETSLMGQLLRDLPRKDAEAYAARLARDNPNKKYAVVLSSK